ncbi:hypothetical protein BgiBS90_028181 [Biomphalaria glabrata]|nr:hypothetical protein BgiBS90_028181 [Biomphalaria glabrata]
MSQCTLSLVKEILMSDDDLVVRLTCSLAYQSSFISGSLGSSHNTLAGSIAYNSFQMSLRCLMLSGVGTCVEGALGVR